MKVLIATQEEYIPFIKEVIQPYANSEHVIMMNFRKPTSDFIDYDVGISFMWTRKIQKFELDIAPWYNFHPAPLPAYKGRSLCYHAILNGETEFGATLHYMDEGFDTGDIVEAMKFMIPEWWTAEQLSNAAIEASKQLFKLYLPFILEGKEFKRLPNKGGAYYKKSQISDTIHLKPDEPFAQFVRAVTYKDFHPKIVIGGVTYKIVRDE